MIFTTPRIDRSHRRATRGFTLTEILISTGISAFILVGILQTFLMIGRSGYNAANYCVMEAESRRAMEQFSQEVRMATAITWASSTKITLTIPTSASSYTVIYTYSGGNFQRIQGANTRTLVRNVTSFAFQRYKLVSGGGSNVASNDLETKQIQLTLQTTMKGVTAAAATNAVLSARYILRNKSVSA